ncbi:3-hydroxyacyl-ACP dehydratase FabZ [Clostridium celatum]|uniref:3-hydroxyacyl-[acyl-carrier-protein] dehydratase FabZ n=1 Tax=Clostridium celatum DSM 1785 TaxID=545697 RepID=L1Q286_9CLOT|nr:3-hydroxyacyl-ACP dehydratase FabZ [Clostridium celatum]EKY22088.1 beta-hydroxyacyl-(acyl-carrier-protein) dehydratase FabZ [Clostridium celatum DSM 1785]MCE9654519.1 3-hydroxyacyl-ACP dehydratase FabZ [Clostridium celatum]MDU3724278.1 3-hydroxyacyl-ACP dehydratase FabZ [Clostridium celatum]MDU6294763.1 3-hydroxyacyl-ACP dehydratase FabZ [Clostridium celatum]MDY3359899.1 3-hydroxyacyl-ACP dehydratase FabZ [Clostridium celatum]
MDIKEIMKIIPHRYPFLLIDKVENIEDNKIVAIKNVSMNEYFFQGHFPVEPVMPGVLIIEALAQAGAVALLSKEEFKGKIAYFAGINNAKFRRKVVPGDTLRLEVELTKIRGRAGVGYGIAYVDDKKVCEGELTFMVG